MFKKIFTLFLCIFAYLRADALELDWRSIPIESINYDRFAVDGGGALFTLSDSNSLKFKIQFVFSDNTFSLPKSDITTFSALSDILILGGFGKKNYTQIEKELTQNGIYLSSMINSLGQLVISCEGLTEDFPRVITLLDELILNPMFNPEALALWKQQSKNAFSNFMNASSMSAQMQFINTEAAKLAFGPHHYFSEAIRRSSPKYTDAVSLKNVQSIYTKVKNRNGLKVLLAGGYPPDAQSQVMHLISKIPSSDISTIKWLPDRLHKPSSKTKTAIIQKKDMTQSQISFRFYYPNLGELNVLEKAQVAILSEIYSSTGGVVGNDRFSKAMRADSGLSYSPHAYFVSDVIDPNTNLSMFTMNFQSDNEKLYDAVSLANKTWNTFVKKGITKPELDNARSSIMNRMLANEITVFDKGSLVFSQILKGVVPSVNPIQEKLESLEAQTNVHEINHFLKRKLGKDLHGILVIMGNPSKKEIKKLKTISELDFIEVTDINSFK